MSRFTFTEFANDNEVFASTAFDGSIGKPVEVTVGGSRVTGTLTAAKVASDRRSVALTVEADIVLRQRGDHDG